MVDNLSRIKRMKGFLSPRRPVFIDPDTGKKFTAKTKVELIQRIVMYRAQNELEPIENLNLVLDNFWATLPENKGLTEEVSLERGFLTYLKGGITLVKTMLYDKVTTKEEADRRGDICIQCPHNIFPEEKSSFAKWADDIAEHAIGDRKSKNHENLGNCEICTCNLRAKVWYGGDVSVDKEDNAKLPDFCWAKK